jgi:mRNA interferase RelE/StbE
MKVSYERSFLKDLKNLGNATALKNIQTAIEAIKQIPTSNEIPHLKKLQGERNFYRIRVGDYRLGITIDGNELTFIRCLHRKEIYKYFP